jgi:hypothetical protein
VNVFSLDRHLIREYASFARSFTKIRAHDIAEQVEHIYAQGTFWPEPLVSAGCTVMPPLLQRYAATKVSVWSEPPQ